MKLMMLFRVNIVNWKASWKQLWEYISKQKDWEYIIEIRKKNRSGSQNKLYWEILSQISKDTWNEKDYLHSFFSARFLKEKVMWPFWWHEDIPSTSTLTIDSFSWYIEKILNFCGEMGIVVNMIET